LNTSNVNEASSEVVALPNKSDNKQGVEKNLSKQNLQGRDFSHTDAKSTDFSGSNLEQANFLFSQLAHSNFTKTNLKNCNFQFAHLESCDLSGAQNITDSQFGGANLSFCKFPRSFKFHSIEQIQELAHSLWVHLITLLLFCLYSWIAIGSTTDLDLLNDTNSIFVPLLEMSLPTIGFFYLTPIIVLAMSLAFNFQLSQYWNRVSKLPTYFPDNSLVTLKTFPTLIDNLIEEYFPYMQHNTGFGHKLKLYLTLAILFCVTPITLISYWIRYLPRHDVLGSSIHVAWILICVTSAYLTWHNIKSTATPETQKRFPTKRFISCILIGWTTLWGLSSAISNGNKLPINSFYMDVSFMNLSKKNDIARVRRQDFGDEKNLNGFIVDGHNLRHANLYYVGFVGGSLKETKLDYADLRKATLDNTNLESAQLAHSKLEQTSLQQVHGIKANFAHAIMNSANLSHSTFSQGDFSHSTLTWADLSHGQFARSDFTQAKLDAVSADHANFQMALFINTSMNKVKLNSANLYLAKVQHSNLWKAELNNAKLILADLSASQLTDASLIEANLSQSTLNNTTMNDAILDRANLSFAKLNGSSFRHASLKEANLDNAQLENADFSHANFSGSNFADAWLEQTILIGADLSNARNLTESQLKQAVIDASTKVPPELKHILQLQRFANTQPLQEGKP